MGPRFFFPRFYLEEKPNDRIPQITTAVIRSEDKGRTWESTPFVIRPPAHQDELLINVHPPVRLEERVAGLHVDLLARSDGKGWSIKENIGHLSTVECLPMQRLGEILAGEAILCAADMTNRATNKADYNSREITELLAEFRKKRGELIARMEQVDEADWGKSALHPRLNQPMRIVDIAHFHGEHDDYHLARISELIRAFG